MDVNNIKKNPRYSYSALSVFLHCPFQFFEKYVLKNIADEQTLALSLGSILHKGKELVSLDLMAGRSPDYATIEQYILNGYIGADKAGEKEERLPGIINLKQRFFEDWAAIDNKSGLTYEEKLENYFDGLKTEEHDTEWHTLGVEVPFEFDFEGVTLFGFIDNISENSRGQLRIVDYKTSKQIFQDKDVKTPLQMLIYYLATQNMYPGREIVQCLYDFIALGKTQEAGTKGWINRGTVKLRKTLASIEECKKTCIWKPAPTPLCYWCHYSKSNPKADQVTKHLCDYHSLYTPEYRDFISVNKPWDGKPYKPSIQFII